MFFKNPFTLPTYLSVQDEIVGEKNLKKILRPVLEANAEIDEKNMYLYNPILTLPINNQWIDYLVQGDLFYDEENNEVYLFFIDKIDKGISFVGMYHLKPSTMHDLLYALPEMISSENAFSQVTSGFYKNINDVDFSKLTFLTNMYYNDVMFTQEISHYFNKEHNKIFGEFFNKTDEFLYSYFEFDILYKEIDNDDVKEGSVGSLRELFVFDTIEHWTPKITFTYYSEYLSMKINKRCYHGDIFYKEDEKGKDTKIFLFHFDTTCFSLAVLRDGNKLIKNNELKMYDSINKFDDFYYIKPIQEPLFYDVFKKKYDHYLLQII